jgi:hypothetical protein
MMVVRSLASSLGVGSVLLLSGCPDDPTPLTSDSEASGSSSGAVDSSTSLRPEPDSSGSSSGDPELDTGSSTTVGPEPETSTGPVDDCGNGMLDEGEVCDGRELGGITCQSEGFDSGTPSCSLDCGEIDVDECGTCGNVIVDGDEVCDSIVLLGQSCESQGFHSGQLGCTVDCLQYDTAGCGTCGNALVDGTEPCDGGLLSGQTCLTQGFDSGTIACAEDCEAFDTVGCGTCGNQEIDGEELCDGPDLAGQSCASQGFDSGQLACTAGCDGYVTTGCGTCGNGVIDGSESCDGALLGGSTCASLGLQGGNLACGPGCQYDFSGCDIAGIPFGNDGFYGGFALMPGVLPCDDISATGIATGLSDDDQVTVPIGFSLDFYDTPFTEANITSNGVVYFDAPDFLPLSGVCPPADTFSLSDEFILGAFWTDLNPGVAGDVYYQTLGPVGSQRFVVQWDVPFYAGDVADLLRIQAMFHQSGTVEVCYVDTLSLNDFRNNGADAAAGIQRDSLLGFSYSCSMPDLTNGLMLMYIPI